MCSKYPPARCSAVAKAGVSLWWRMAGRARTVEIGHRNALEAKLVKGVGGGEEVILHPGNQVTEGTRVSH